MILHLIAEEEEIVFVPVVLGYYHRVPMSAGSELELTRDGAGALQRMYAQSGPRQWDTLQVGRTYHPDIGFLDNRGLGGQEV